MLSSSWLNRTEQNFWMYGTMSALMDGWMLVARICPCGWAAGLVTVDTPEITDGGAPTGVRIDWTGGACC